MTISITRRVKRYTGDGATTEFPYDFLIPTEENLKVYTYDTITNVRTLLSSAVYDADGFGDADNFGTVTYPLSGDPIDSDTMLIIVRDMPYEQELDIQTTFYPATLEAQLDRHEMQIQQLAEMLGRAPLALEGDAFSGPVGSKDFLAGKFLSFDGEGNPEPGPAVESVGTVGLAIASQVQAEALTSDSVAMTPLKTEMAIGKYTDTIRLEYYMRRYNDPVVALKEAFRALYNETVDGKGRGLRLACDDIVIRTPSPILIRPDDLGLDEDYTEADHLGKVIEDLHIELHDTGAYTWQPLDYLFSFAGDKAAGHRLTWFIFNRAMFMLGNKPVIGFHLNSYLHATLNHIRMRGLNDGSIGIASTKWSRTSGIGEGVTENQSNGMAILECDIADVSTGNKSSIGIYTESGDFNVCGGWLSDVSRGIVTTKGDMNTRGVHFSLNRTATNDNRRIALHALQAQTISCVGDELDGCIYVFEDSPDNTETPGTASGLINNIRVLSHKHSILSANMPAFDGTDDEGNTISDATNIHDGADKTAGFVTFIAHEADTAFRGISISPDWVGMTGGPANQKLVKWMAVSGASFIDEGATDLYVQGGGVGGVDVGNLPAAGRLGVAKLNDAGCAWNPGLQGLANPGLEFWDAATTEKRPRVVASGNSLVICTGSGATGEPEQAWSFRNTGLLEPVTDGDRDIGSSSKQIKDLYAKGGLKLGDGATGIHVDNESATGNSVTINRMAGVITSGSLTTAAGATQSITVTNSKIAAGDIVLANIRNGTNSAGRPIIGAVTPASGSVVIQVINDHASAALDGTVIVSFFVLKVA